MEGYSDSALRRVCKAVNPSLLTYTEFTSADGVRYGAKKVIEKLRFFPEERPILAQVFGKNSDAFVTAAKWCEDQGFTGIDLNMGCPAKKVVKSEHGVALRKKPDLAFRLIETVANATRLPVSVKTRLGWSDADDLVTFGKGAENAGANMICIHARTYVNPYNVPAQFEPVYALKHALHIPVLGNGGIVSVADGMTKLGNLDGFLIGQAAVGNPWVFDPHGKTPATFAEKRPIILLHAKYLIDLKGDYVGAREIRKHLLSYVREFPGAKAFRSRMTHVESYADVVSVLDDIATHLQSDKSASQSAIISHA
jgi:nifR3 family TIM-barrel protein